MSRSVVVWIMIFSLSPSFSFAFDLDVVALVELAQGEGTPSKPRTTNNSRKSIGDGKRKQGEGCVQKRRKYKLHRWMRVVCCRVVCFDMQT
ncbi:hypothetical protein F5H01DRAFT_337403 [Linnemannia elongata]|nr:hypothetical protein F5H01DRAFT_337403 [Linnemannia elongata]